MANRQQVYEGIERRTGLERRAVAPQKAKGGPRLIGAVAVGAQTFGPGQEKAFMDAVTRVNSEAKESGKGPRIDLDRLSQAGAISGFEQVEQAQALAASRSRQREIGEREAVEIEHDAAAVNWPGRQTLDQVAPPPVGPEAVAGTPMAAQVGAAEEGKPAPARATARRGGAGRTSGRKR